ncbi:UNVERIFIED_CONTAM: hypothetical protein FKN15_074196 [Acipenser sinensis]
MVQVPTVLLDDLRHRLQATAVMGNQAPPQSTRNAGHEPVATELCLLSSTLLQISGLQGQALGQSLASLVVAHRQLWLLQTRVPDAAKTASRGRSSLWQAPQACTVTRMVQVPTVLLDDLRHRLQATAVMGNQAPPQSTRNAGHGVSTNSIPGGNSTAVALGNHLRVHCPNLSSPSRSPEGLRSQNYPFASQQL